MSRRGYPDRALRLMAAVVLAVLAALAIGSCHSAQAAERAPASVRVAPASALYRHRVEQAAARAWGVHGSPARLAAQLHQESGFRADARSPVGAQGIAQFMPKTATWIATVFPKDLGAFDPWNAQQAILAAALYDRWLLDRVAVYDGTIEMQLTPAGEFRPNDGRELPVPAWYIDSAVAERVIARFNAKNKPLVVDYEHQTLNKETNGQPAPAAAWMRALQWREGSGLWAIARPGTRRSALWQP